MKKLILTALIILGASTTQNAYAQDNTYTIDTSHTNVLLRLSHLGFSQMVLEALNPEGTITFDEKNPTNSAVNITIKSTNIDGDDEKFNTHLQSPDFFNAAQYPEITFKSTKVEVTGDNKGIITGDLTLLGTTKPVKLDVTFNKAGQNPFNKKATIGFSATGTINRSDFNMTYGLPLVGEEVTLDINVEATK